MQPCVPKFHDVEVVRDAQPPEAFAVRDIREIPKACEEENRETP